MSGDTITEIDFENWATLASSDPQKFEALRQDKISGVLNSVSGTHHQRLVGLQWQIDTMRAQHKDSSMAACLAISELMWDTFNQLANVLKSQAESSFQPPIPPMQANIIRFPNESET